MVHHTGLFWHETFMLLSDPWWQRVNVKLLCVTIFMNPFVCVAASRLDLEKNTRPPLARQPDH